MLDNPWYSVVALPNQLFYQPVQDFKYWLVLDYLNNWNIITFSNKNTTGEDFKKHFQVVFDEISDNMDSMVKYGKYDDMNTKDTTKLVYYVVNYVSDASTLQEETRCDE